MAPGDERDLIEAVVTCEGNLHDPDFSERFQSLVCKLKSVLYTTTKRQPFEVRKIEPWNSVRVTISIPKEAAQRLRLLAQQGSSLLRQLGILSVQVEGDQVISLTLAGRFNEPQEVLLRPNNESTDLSTPTPGTSSRSPSSICSTLSSGSASVAGKESVAGSSGVIASLDVLSSTSSAFRSPNVVAPGGEAIPFPPKATPVGLRPTLGGPFPFASMTHAAYTMQRSESNSNNSVTSSAAPNSTNLSTASSHKHADTSPPVLTPSVLPAPAMSGPHADISAPSPAMTPTSLNTQSLSTSARNVRNVSIDMNSANVTVVSKPQPVLVTAVVNAKGNGSNKTCSGVSQTNSSSNAFIPPSNPANVVVVVNSTNFSKTAQVQGDVKLNPSQQVQHPQHHSKLQTVLKTSSLMKEKELASIASPGNPQLTSTGKPRQFLINPLTGHLEPMPSESSSESDAEDNDGRPGHLQKGTSRSKSSKGKDGSSPAAWEKLSPPKPLKITLDALKLNRMGGSVSSKWSKDDSETSVSAKENSVVHVNNTTPAEKGDKIKKLRLKLEKPESPTSYRMDIAYMKKSEKSAVTTVMSSGALTASGTAGGHGGPSSSSSAVGVSNQAGTATHPEVPRVPPLHISLRGKNAAVVVSPRRDEPKDTSAFSLHSGLNANPQSEKLVVSVSNPLKSSSSSLALKRAKIRLKSSDGSNHGDGVSSKKVGKHQSPRPVPSPGLEETEDPLKARLKAEEKPNHSTTDASQIPSNKVGSASDLISGNPGAKAVNASSSIVKVKRHRRKSELLPSSPSPLSSQLCEEATAKSSGPMDVESSQLMKLLSQQVTKSTVDDVELNVPCSSAMSVYAASAETATISCDTEKDPLGTEPPPLSLVSRVAHPFPPALPGVSAGSTTNEQLGSMIGSPPNLHVPSKASDIPTSTPVEGPSLLQPKEGKVEIKQESIPESTLQPSSDFVNTGPDSVPPSISSDKKNDTCVAPVEGFPISRVQKMESTLTPCVENQVPESTSLSLKTSVRYEPDAGSAIHTSSSADISTKSDLRADISVNISEKSLGHSAVLTSFSDSLSNDSLPKVKSDDRNNQNSEHSEDQNIRVNDAMKTSYFAESATSEDVVQSDVPPKIPSHSSTSLEKYPSSVEGSSALDSLRDRKLNACEENSFLHKRVDVMDTNSSSAVKVEAEKSHVTSRNHPESVPMEVDVACSVVSVNNNKNEPVLANCDGENSSADIMAAPVGSCVDLPPGRVGALCSPSVSLASISVPGVKGDDHGTVPGEDSGIDSMDALSEKSPNQGESPARKCESDHHFCDNAAPNSCSQGHLHESQKDPASLESVVCESEPEQRLAPTSGTTTEASASLPESCRETDASASGVVEDLSKADSDQCGSVHATETNIIESNSCRNQVPSSSLPRHLAAPLPTGQSQISPEGSKVSVSDAFDAGTEKASTAGSSSDERLTKDDGIQSSVSEPADHESKDRKPISCPSDAMTGETGALIPRSHNTADQLPSEMISPSCETRTEAVEGVGQLAEDLQLKHQPRTVGVDSCSPFVDDSTGLTPTAISGSQSPEVFTCEQKSSGAEQILVAPTEPSRKLAMEILTGTHSSVHHDCRSEPTTGHLMESLSPLEKSEYHSDDKILPASAISDVETIPTSTHVQEFPSVLSLEQPEKLKPSSQQVSSSQASEEQITSGCTATVGEKEEMFKSENCTASTEAFTSKDEDQVTPKNSVTPSEPDATTEESIPVIADAPEASGMNAIEQHDDKTKADMAKHDCALSSSQNVIIPTEQTARTQKQEQEDRETCTVAAQSNFEPDTRPSSQVCADKSEDLETHPPAVVHANALEPPQEISSNGAVQPKSSVSIFNETHGQEPEKMISKKGREEAESEGKWQEATDTNPVTSVGVTKKPKVRELEDTNVKTKVDASTSTRSGDLAKAIIYPSKNPCAKDEKEKLQAVVHPALIRLSTDNSGVPESVEKSADPFVTCNRASWKDGQLPVLIPAPLIARDVSAVLEQTEQAGTAMPSRGSVQHLRGSPDHSGSTPSALKVVPTRPAASTVPSTSSPQQSPVPILIRPNFQSPISFKVQDQQNTPQYSRQSSDATLPPRPEIKPTVNLNVTRTVSSVIQLAKATTTANLNSKGPVVSSPPSCHTSKASPLAVNLAPLTTSTGLVTSTGSPTVFAIHPHQYHSQSAITVLPAGHKMVPIKLVTIPKQNQTQIPIGASRSSPTVLETVNLVAATSRASSPSSTVKPKAIVHGNAVPNSQLNLSSVAGGNILVPLSVSSGGPAGGASPVKVLVSSGMKVQPNLLQSVMVKGQIVMANQNQAHPTTIRVVRPLVQADPEPPKLEPVNKVENNDQRVAETKVPPQVERVENIGVTEGRLAQGSIYEHVDGVQVLETEEVNDDDLLPFTADIIHDEKDLEDVLAGENTTVITQNGLGLNDLDETGEIAKNTLVGSETAKSEPSRSDEKFVREGKSLNSSPERSSPVSDVEADKVDSPIPAIRASSPLYTYSMRSGRNSHCTSESRSPSPTEPDVHGEDQEIIECLSRSPLHPPLSPQSSSSRGVDNDQESVELNTDHIYGSDNKSTSSSPGGKLGQLSIDIPPVEMEVMSPAMSEESKKSVRSTRSNTRLVSPDITAFRSDTPKPVKFSNKPDVSVLRSSPKPSPTGSVRTHSPDLGSIQLSVSASTSPVINQATHSSSSGFHSGGQNSPSLAAGAKGQGVSSLLSKRKRQESDSSSASKDENSDESKVDVDLNSRPGKRRCSENAAELIKACIGVEDTPKRSSSLLKKTEVHDYKPKESASTKGKKPMMTVVMEENEEDLDDEPDVLNRGRCGGRSSRGSSEDRSSSRGSSSNRNSIMAKPSAKEDEHKEAKPGGRVANRTFTVKKGTNETKSASGLDTQNSNSSKKDDKTHLPMGRRSNRNASSKEKSPLAIVKPRANIRKEAVSSALSEKQSVAARGPENGNPRRKTRSSVAGVSDSGVPSFKRRRVSKDAKS